MLDYNTWGKLVSLEQEFFRRGEPFGRSTISEVMHVGTSVAEKYAYALKYKDVIRYKPNVINTSSGERVGVITDVHIPYQDQAALEAALSYLEEQGVTIIVILGDLIDFYQISRFIKNPKKKKVSDEIKATRKFLQDLRKRFPAAKIIYKKGNHEDRMDAYLMQNASEVYDLIDQLLEMSLGLNDLNIDFVEDPFQVGKLWFLHGHEKPGGSYNPEYICNVMFKYILDHFIVGHYHRNQMKPFKRIDNSVYQGIALGYLAGVMDYAKLNQWNHGVALIKYESDGRFKPEVKAIVDGELY